MIPSTQALILASLPPLGGGGPVRNRSVANKQPEAGGGKRPSTPRKDPAVGEGPRDGSLVPIRGPKSGYRGRRVVVTTPRHREELTVWRRTLPLLVPSDLVEELRAWSVDSLAEQGVRGTFAPREQPAKRLSHGTSSESLEQDWQDQRSASGRPLRTSGLGRLALGLATWSGSLGCLS